ncbi:MAG: hypothetical protein ACYCV7_03960 [Acidimicrobiales bacterium]
MQPLTDQQISGFVSKFSMLSVLPGDGWVVLTRAHGLGMAMDGDDDDDEPLYWADV